MHLTVVGIRDSISKMSCFRKSLTPDDERLLYNRYDEDVTALQANVEQNSPERIPRRQNFPEFQLNIAYYVYWHTCACHTYLLNINMSTYIRTHTHSHTGMYAHAYVYAYM